LTCACCLRIPSLLPPLTHLYAPILSATSSASCSVLWA
jgi:hypothetical protein